MTTPSPFPVSPAFPVTWERPEDQRLFWHTDVQHFPTQSSPMMEFFYKTFNDGFHRAALAYQLPVTLVYRRFNSWTYNAVTPLVPHEEMEAQGKKAESLLKAAIAQFPERWDKEWLPEVKGFLASWESFDLSGCSMEALLAHFQQTEERHTRLWEIHFLLAVPFIMAMSLFDELYQDLVGQKEEGLGAYKMLQGRGNKTVESGHALWNLSRKARASQEVRRALDVGSTAAVLKALEGTPAGHAFLGAFRAYLEEYGQRSDVFAELSCPSWVEDPTTPLANLRDYLASDRDPAQELVQLGKGREQAIAAMRARLNGYPRAVVEQFEFFLKAAQAATVLQEDHNYWIDQRSMHKARMVLLEFGRRFAKAGALYQPSDIFYLTPDELRQTAAARPHTDRRRLVEDRKSEMKRFAGAHPPALGTPPAGPPPQDPLGRALGRFFGTPPAASPSPDVILGNPGSPGKVRGTARVLLTLAEAGKLRKGDILVAPSTMPAWTPLFATAAAVVTDAGGVLSHCAIVAREYNIPAVVGTGRATAILKDGQSIEVDGDKGIVRVL